MIKRYAWLMAFLLMALNALGGNPIRKNSAFEQYIERYKGIAITEMRKYGIPASITLAQGLLESGAGRSELAVKGNNHFGIKCHGWDGRTIYHDDDLNGECFRAYDNALESFEDHSKFLAGRERYRRLFSLPCTDYRGWATGLKACGYATNPRYAQNLIDIIETYELYVYDNTPDDHNNRAQVVAESMQPSTLTPTLTGHPIRRYNGNYYVYARTGDTFKSIAKETGKTAKALADANERDTKDVLHEGEIIYLQTKAKRADKQFKKHPHVVQNGQSLYLISQLYGIRLKNLIKMNPWLKDKDYQVRVGDVLRVY